MSANQEASRADGNPNPDLHGVLDTATLHYGLLTDGAELPAWWPNTFDLEIPDYHSDLDEPQLRADYLISMAVVAKGLLMISRRKAVVAQELFNKALVISLLNDFASDLRDTLRWYFEDRFRDAANPDPFEMERKCQAYEYLKLAGIEEGIYVMVDGVVLEFYPSTPNGVKAAIAFADNLSRDPSERVWAFDQFKVEDYEFTTSVYEVGKTVELIHEVAAVEEE